MRESSRVLLRTVRAALRPAAIVRRSTPSNNEFHFSGHLTGLCVNLKVEQGIVPHTVISLTASKKLLDY